MKEKRKIKVLMIFTLFLLCSVCCIEKVMREKIKEAQEIIRLEEKQEGIINKKNKSGYSEILDAIEENQSRKIIKFMRKDSEKGKVFVQVQILGDVEQVEDYIRSVEKKKNFIKIEEISMKREGINKHFQVETEFLKNR